MTFYVPLCTFHIVIILKKLEFKLFSLKAAQKSGLNEPAWMASNQTGSYSRQNKCWQCAFLDMSCLGLGTKTHLVRIRKRSCFTTKSPRKTSCFIATNTAGRNTLFFNWSGLVSSCLLRIGSYTRNPIVHRRHVFLQDCRTPAFKVQTWAFRYLSSLKLHATLNWDHQSSLYTFWNKITKWEF